MTEPAARNAGHAFALVAIDELARQGVTDAVAAPGSRSTPLALAFAGEPRIRLHVRIDERSAAFLALGLARATGRPAPVLCTSGTAAAHFHAAALEADQSGVPMLLMTADRPPELHGIGANQTIDQHDLYGRAVRWSCDVPVPESGPGSVAQWRTLIARAVATSLGTAATPPGPVHLNLPLREPLTPTHDDVGFPYPLHESPVTAAPPARHRPAPPMPADLPSLLAGAPRGIVVAGDGLSETDVAGLTEFSAGAGWPLIAEPHSNARRGPTALRAADGLLGCQEFVAAHRPDLVLVAGRVGLSRAVLGWLSESPHVIVDPLGRGPNPARTARAGLAGGFADLPALAPSSRAPDQWPRDWLAASAAAAAAVDDLLDTGALSEPAVARDTALIIRAGDDGDPPPALVVASSMPIRDLDLTMRPDARVRIVANRGVSGIDGFVSTAMGVAFGHDAPTYALAGDLSFLHDVNALLGGDRPDLTVVVVNNDGGGIFSMLPQATAVARPEFEQLFGTPHRVDLARLAAAYGVSHTRVTSRRGLRTALRRPPSGVRIVEVRTERAANAALHARLRAAAVDAVRRCGSSPAGTSSAPHD